MKHHYLGGKTGIILAFAINSRESFDDAAGRLAIVAKEKGANYPIVISGNKSDLDAQREVFEGDVQKEMISKHGLKNATYIETCSKEGRNVK